MTLPCGIALRVNNSILVESVFHGAKGAKFGEIEKYFSLPSLRSWRLGTIRRRSDKLVLARRTQSEIRLLEYPAASRGVTQ